MINPNELPNGLNWFPSIFLTLFASIGGLIGYLYRNYKEKEIIGPVQAVIEMIAGGFVGSIVMMVCFAYQIDSAWIGPIVGISGWNAGLTVKILQTLVQKRLEVKENEIVKSDTGNDIDKRGF